jgi:hypothetical protein
LRATVAQQLSNLIRQVESLYRDLLVLRNLFRKLTILRFVTTPNMKRQLPLSFSSQDETDCTIDPALSAPSEIAYPLLRQH